MTSTLYRYQLQDVRRLHRMGGRALVAWDMGLGKTPLAWHYIYRHPALRPAVIVCPASLKWNWHAEGLAHVGINALVLESRKPPKLGLGVASHPVYIINYDVLGPWLSWLKALGPQLVIADEVQMIASRTAKRTKALGQLCRGVNQVIALSGTPLVNRPAELWPVLNILNPKKYSSFWTFANSHCQPHKAPWGWTYNGASKLDQLHQDLTDSLMLRRRKADVLTDLPAKRRHVLLLPLQDEREYQRAQTDFINWLGEWSVARAQRAAKAEKVTRLGYLKRLAGQLKLRAIMEWTDSFLLGCEGKLILFGVHQSVLTALQQRYSHCSVLLDGNTPMKERQVAVEAFQYSKKIRLFIGNVRAAGVGLNLTAAQAVAFVELDWVPGVHQQCEDRAHRIGQGRQVDVYYLIARETIEEQLLAVLQDKQQVLDAVLDGAEGVVDFDVYDRLCANLLLGSS